MEEVLFEITEIGYAIEVLQLKIVANLQNDDGATVVVKREGLR